MYPDRKPKVIMALTCRYYENRYPEIDDVVMVNVRSIADMGAYVHLLEYNNIEGKTVYHYQKILLKKVPKKSPIIRLKG